MHGDPVDPIGKPYRGLGKPLTADERAIQISRAPNPYWPGAINQQYMPNAILAPATLTQWWAGLPPSVTAPELQDLDHLAAQFTASE